MKINKGITLIEILVTIGLMGLILGMTFYFFGGFSSKESLEKDIAGLTAVIRNARLLSVASKDASVFGVHLESDKAVLFEGNPYVAGGANEKIMEFSKNVYLYSYSLNLGVPDIIFDRLTGNTSNFGSITLSLKDDSASTTITILSTGVVQ